MDTQILPFLAGCLCYVKAYKIGTVYDNHSQVRAVLPLVFVECISCTAVKTWEVNSLGRSVCRPDDQNIIQHRDRCLN